MLDAATYILTYRRSTPDREDNLKAMVGYLFYHFGLGLDVIIVEQDSEPRLSLPLPPNFRHKFIYNPGLFNRSWASNVGERASSKPVVVFGGIDALVRPHHLMEGIRRVYGGLADAVRPFQRWVWMNEPDTKSFSRTYDLDLASKDCSTTEVSPGSGLLVVSRRFNETCGGWDEEFEGWGAEDTSYAHKLQTCGSYIQLPFEVYHLYHDRAAGEFPYGHANYNVSEFQLKPKALNAGRDSILERSKNTFHLLGNTQKYMPGDKRA